MMFKKIYIILFFFILPAYTMDTPENEENIEKHFIDYGLFPVGVPYDIFYKIATFLSFPAIMRLNAVSKMCNFFWHEDTRSLSFDEATLVLSNYAEKKNEVKFDYFWMKNDPDERLRAARLRCKSNDLSLETKMEVYRDGCFVPLKRQEQILKDDFAKALKARDVCLMKTMFIGAQFPLFDKNTKNKKHIGLICKIKDFSLFKLFLDGADRINEADEWRCSVLYYAVKYGTIEMIQYLLENGVKVNVCDYKGNYPLHYAAWLGKISVIKILCQHEAKVNVINDNKETPLHLAARFGRYKCIQVLMNQKNIDKELKNALMQTPLNVTAVHGCNRSARILIKKGAHLKTRDAQCRTPLHNACMKGRVEIAKILIKAGAAVNPYDLYGDTPLDLVRFVKNKNDKTQLELRNLLLANGAKLAFIDNAEIMVSTID